MIGKEKSSISVFPSRRWTRSVAPTLYTQLLQSKSSTRFPSHALPTTLSHLSRFSKLRYSPLVFGIEKNGVLATARELGIAVIAYSPLGRGLVTGQYVRCFPAFRARFKALTCNLHLLEISR